MGKLKSNSALAMVSGVVLIVSFASCSSACSFPAAYNFGDSNSDTGAVSAAFGRLPFPYGQTFFGKPSGRYSDGRLIIDFMANTSGLPLLNAYLDSLQPNFRHGANFAAGGATIQPWDGQLFEAGFNPLTLNVQLSQFEQLKDRTKELYAQAKRSHTKPEKTLPRPKDFSRALYSLDCGQNDLHFFVTTMTEEQAKASIPNVTNQFTQAIEDFATDHGSNCYSPTAFPWKLLQKLYQEGARKFWIHNTGPIGCLPFMVINYPPKPGDADQIGCVKSYNEVAQEFNEQLKERVSQLSTQLPDAELIYVDIYSAKYTLISEANKYGFAGPFEYCCGNYDVKCWEKAIVNATDALCNDPSKYISWDGVHYSETANYWIATHIVDGSYSDPPIPLNEAC